MNERQIRAMLGELEAQRNIFATRAGQLAADNEGLRELNEQLQAELAQYKAAPQDKKKPAKR